MDKKYKVITTPKRDRIIKVKCKDIEFTLVREYNSIGGSYPSTELQVLDDNWQALRRNLWVLDLDYSDPTRSLRDLGFTEVQSFATEEKEIDFELAIDKVLYDLD